MFLFVVTVILLLFAVRANAASGSAQHSMEVDDSIAGIVGQVILGGVKDVLPTLWKRATDSEGTGRGNLLPLPNDSGFCPTLRIDGISRIGWRAWAEAGWRVVGYAADTQHAGSVCYDYRLRIRGYDIRRQTEIADGYVLLTTSTGWIETVKIGRLTREIPIHVSISIRADETDLRTTRIVGSATGTADTRDFQCRIVRRIAEQRAAAELDSGLTDALLRIQRDGTGFYRGGASDVLSALEAIDIGER